jgi:hypothetical protein
MNIVTLIEKFGVNAIADIANVSTMSVYNWKNLESIPRPETALRLIVWSNGFIDWEGIYYLYFKNSGVLIEKNGQLKMAV